MSSCSKCSSERLYRDGLRYLTDRKTVQRWLCRSCGYRFSGESTTKSFYRTSSKGSDCQIGAVPKAHGQVRNLVELKPPEEGSAGATIQAKAENGGIFEFLWWLKKQNRSKSTIDGYSWALHKIVEKGAYLEDPESVKDTLARNKFGNSTKRAIIIAYTTFLRMNGKQWQRPRITVTRKLPFIPLEREIDDLVAGTGKKMATFLKLLKETGMRAGEGRRIKWTDIDIQRNLITLNEPEKNGNPRIFKVSLKLLGMIERLPKVSQTIFNCTYGSLKSSLRHSKKRLARKLNNPRLLKITFHSLRHWKATLEYHLTKDILHVKELLGHKKLDTTMLYIQIAEHLFQQEPDEFTVKIAKTQEEITTHLEVGFEWIGEKDGAVFLRKRK